MNENLRAAAEQLSEDIQHTMAWAKRNAQTQEELDRFRLELLHSVMGTDGDRSKLLLELARVGTA